MNYKQKVTELLKTVPEIKKKIEELRFGCKVFIQNHITSITIIGDNRGLAIIEGTEYTDFLGQVGTYTQSFTEKHIKNIIGNPLEERFLRMYCLVKGICFNQTEHGNIHLSYMGKKVIITLNNTFSFDEQSEKVREQLFNFLNELVGQK